MPGSVVLYVYAVFFFRPAGRKKNTRRVKIRGLRKSYGRFFSIAIGLLTPGS
jgi:hypothetical protein